MSTWLITNPSAGQGEDGRQGERLRELARQREITIHETREAGDARRLGRQAVEQRVATIVVAGGDGTVSEVINGMAADFTASRLGIIPLGTANDFAATLGVPTQVDAAVALLDGADEDPPAGATLSESSRNPRGVERWVDVVRTDSKDKPYIMNASTGGFSELVHDQLDDQMKQRWGPLAYLRAAMQAMPQACNYQTRLEVDGEHLNVQACAVIIANGRSAGGMTLAQDARVDDHRLDLLIITAEQFFDRLRLASHFAVGSHLDDENLIYRQARRVRIEADPPMRFSSDGEMIGQTPITFEVVPQTLRILVPAATSP